MQFIFSENNAVIASSPFQNGVKFTLLGGATATLAGADGTPKKGARPCPGWFTTLLTKEGKEKIGGKTPKEFYETLKGNYEELGACFEFLFASSLIKGKMLPDGSIQEPQGSLTPLWVRYLAAHRGEGMIDVLNGFRDEVVADKEILVRRDKGTFVARDGSQYIGESLSFDLQ